MIWRTRNRVHDLKARMAPNWHFLCLGVYVMPLPYEEGFALWLLLLPCLPLKISYKSHEKWGER